MLSGDVRSQTWDQPPLSEITSHGFPIYIIGVTFGDVWFFCGGVTSALRCDDAIPALYYTSSYHLIAFVLANAERGHVL